VNYRKNRTAWNCKKIVVTKPSKKGSWSAFFEQRTPFELFPKTGKKKLLKADAKMNEIE
jgi:hypothetical protein